MTNLNELRRFLVKAKQLTYASGNESIKTKENDNSTTLIFEDGDFKYHDNYFGGEPYGGREVVFYHGEPVYMMVYYGFVAKDASDINNVYSVLQKALSLIPEDHPYRGPIEFKEGDYQYSNEYHGEVDNFSGQEFIEHNGKIIYEASYIGGLVDQAR
ncbi:MAG: DUF5680 domain-containing protein [Sphaerochaetaceae bacterium]